MHEYNDRRVSTEFLTPANERKYLFRLQNMIHASIDTKQPRSIIYFL